MSVPVYISQPQTWIPTTEPFDTDRGHQPSAFGLSFLLTPDVRCPTPLSEPERPARHYSCAGDSGRFSGI